GKDVVVPEGTVDPVPARALAPQGEMFGVVAREAGHDQLQYVPLRRQHVWQGQAAAGLPEADRPLAALRNVMFVDVDGKLAGTPLQPRRVRLDVHRVHEGVLGERKREAADRLGAVAEGEVVAEGFFRLEGNGHDRFSLLFTLRWEALAGTGHLVSHQE